MDLLYSDRILAIGKTGSGKSTLAMMVGMRRKPPHLVIDPKGSEVLARWPGIVDINDPRAWRPDEVATTRFIPPDQEDLDAYDVLYQQAYDRRLCWILCDEALDVFPVNKRGGVRRKVLTQGRGLQIGHWANTQRPVDINKYLRSESEHFFVWTLQDPDDRVAVARGIGIDRSTLEAALARRQNPDFVHYPSSTGKLRIVRHPHFV